MTVRDEPRRVSNAESPELSFRFGRLFGWFLFWAGTLASALVVFATIRMNMRGPTVGMTPPVFLLLMFTVPGAVLGLGLAQRNRWALRFGWLVLFALVIATFQSAQPGEQDWKVALPCMLGWGAIMIYYWRHRRLFH